MHERNFGKLFGDFQHGVHIPEAGGEDEIVVFTGHIEHDTLGVRPLGHGFDVSGGDPIHFIDEQPALVVGIGPAGIADG